MSKQEVLLENGTFNRNYEKVREQRFADDDFYDAQDLVQVKYEMLRTAREAGRTVGDVADTFGFSRAGFYKIKTSFEKEGVSAFVPGKTGPKNALKLTSEHKEFIDRYLAENPKASSAELAAILKNERGLSISKRTVERYRSSQSRHY